MCIRDRYRNTGAQFDDVTDVSGVTSFSHRMTAWGTGAFDFDNDGQKDLFTACLLYTSVRAHRRFKARRAIEAVRCNQARE